MHDSRLILVIMAIGVIGWIVLASINPNDLQTWTTILIAVFTATLAWSTERLWSATKKTADLASENVAALKRLEVGILIPGLGDYKLVPAQGPYSNQKAIYRVTVQQAGRSLCILKRIRFGLCAVEEFKPSLPTTEDIIDERPIYPYDGMHRTSAKFTVEGDDMISYGEIEYIDLFGDLKTASWNHRVSSSGRSTALEGTYSRMLTKS